MADISIWGYDFSRGWLSQTEAEYLVGLPQSLPTVEWVWQEMDRIWHHFRLDNFQPLSKQPIGEYYSHPVWLMNGIFTSSDPVSIAHRMAITRYLSQIKAKAIADYGGGFGSLALAVTQSISDASVSIVEPYPFKVGVERLRIVPRIKFVPDLTSGDYDAIVAQDVLEHVEDPVRLASEIAAAVRRGGEVIFANCFFPVIQCHLPSTFHLRYTFPYVMKALGLKHKGCVKGAEHAQIFIHTGQVNFARAQRAEALSRVLGPVINKVLGCSARIKRVRLRE